MYKLIKEAEKEIEIKELKNKLEKLADDDFYHEMKDHWTQDDFNKSDRIDNEIKEIISSLDKLGVKTTYKLGYPIEYSDTMEEAEIDKDSLDKAIKEEFINVYGYPEDVSPEFDDTIDPDFYEDVKNNVKNKLINQDEYKQKKSDEKDYKRYKKELDALRKNHSTDIDYIDFLFNKIKEYESKYLNEASNDSLIMEVMDFLKDYDIYEYRNNYSDDEEAYNDIVTDPDVVISYLKDIFTNNETTSELSNKAKSLYLKLTQGTDDVDLINAGREPENRINESSDDKLTEEQLENLYYMDRVLRSMNNEEALSDTWLMNAIADGDTDAGIDYFKEEYRPILTQEDYNDMYELYKNLVKSTLDGGIISRKYYKGKTGYKPTAGASDKELEFVKKDFPNIVILESDEIMEKTDASFLGKERIEGLARLKNDITTDLESSGESIDSIDFRDIFSKLDRIGEVKVNNKVYKKEDYLNDKDIMEYLSTNYSGSKISRRIADDKSPNSIVTVSNQLNIDLYDLIKIIESMCQKGLASEVEDGIYLIK